MLAGPQPKKAVELARLKLPEAQLLPYIIVGVLLLGGIISLVEAWRNSGGDAFDD